MEETAYQIINKAFVDHINDSRKDKVRELALRYVFDKTRHLSNPPDGLVVGVHKIANLVRFSINARVNGKSVQGSREWTEMDLLATNVPVTKLFDELIKDVFEVPLEGTPIS